MIMYYIIFASSTNGQLIATVSFGINSGAYVAEIFRSGISSVERGQFEAGRSLGMNYVQTMWYIIIPQAIKNCLPPIFYILPEAFQITLVQFVKTFRDIG